MYSNWKQVTSKCIETYLRRWSTPVQTNGFNGGQWWSFGTTWTFILQWSITQSPFEVLYGHTSRNFGLQPGTTVPLMIWMFGSKTVVSLPSWCRDISSKLSLAWNIKPTNTGRNGFSVLEIMCTSSSNRTCSPQWRLALTRNWHSGFSDLITSIKT